MIALQFGAIYSHNSPCGPEGRLRSGVWVGRALRLMLDAPGFILTALTLAFGSVYLALVCAFCAGQILAHFAFRAVQRRASSIAAKFLGKAHA